MTNDLGDWRVDVNDDQPDMVNLSFSEIETDGVFVYSVHLPPDTARDMGQALLDLADSIDH